MTNADAPRPTPASGPAPASVPAPASGPATVPGPGPGPGPAPGGSGPAPGGPASVAARTSTTAAQAGPPPAPDPRDAPAIPPDPRDAPAIPPDLRAAAKRAPDHWLGMVDPAWSGEGPPPSWAVRGEWRTDAAGEIVEWRENEEYRASPSARGWPPPTDEVDEAVQLAVTGYGPAEEVTRRLAQAEVAVPVDPEGRPLLAATPDGIPVIPVHTSAAQVDALGRLAYEAVPVTLLLDLLEPEQRLLLNPGGAASLLLETDALRRAAAGERPAV